MPSKSSVLSDDEKEQAILRFVEFLQFETVSSLGPTNGAYEACADWLVERCRATGVFDEVFLLEEAPDHSPVVVAVWKGVDPTLPVLIGNSHYDVVPADPAEWTVPPFEGLRRDGNIYGRGTQDMKCVCIQYIESLAILHARNPDWRPERSLYLTFVPDEEIGGAGMAAFLDSQLYKSLPGIALALDEGLASTDDSTYAIFYGERLPWWVDVTAHGPTGHGSRFIEHTAVEQLVELANKALAFREGQRAKIGLDAHHNCAHAQASAASKAQTTSSTKTSLGDVTSLNITHLQAGVRVGDTYAFNCVPPVAKCTMDIRISPHTKPSEVGALLDSWCQECSKDPPQHAVSWKFNGNGNDLMEHAVTSTDPVQNPWYRVFAQAIEDGNDVQIAPQVFPAATDSRFLRALGIRALGFSPMKGTEIMLHENDEYIPEAVFLEGIDVYIGLWKALGSQGKEIEDELKKE